MYRRKIKFININIIFLSFFSCIHSLLRAGQLGKNDIQAVLQHSFLLLSGSIYSLHSLSEMSPFVVSLNGESHCSNAQTYNFIFLQNNGSVMNKQTMKYYRVLKMNFSYSHRFIGETRKNIF